MRFSSKDFPLLQVILAQKDETAKAVQAALDKAVHGGDDDKYNFALTIQPLAYQVSMPGQVGWMNNQTLRACYAVFKAAAANGHQGAKHMVTYNEQHGYGCAKKPASKPPRP